MPTPDAQTSSGIVNNTSKTVAHTVAAGSNLAIYAKVCQWAVSDANGLCTGVTYNGVALTKIADSGYAPSAGDRAMIFRLLAPATGANNMVFTFAGGGLNGGIVVIESYSSVNQTTPEGTAATNTGTGSTAVTVTVSCAASDICIDATEADGGLASSITMAADSGRTQTGNSNSNSGLGAASYDTSPGGSEVMDWTLNANATWAIAGIAIKDAGGPPPVFHGLYRSGKTRFFGRRPSRTGK